jgi:hypothetical protein
LWCNIPKHFFTSEIIEKRKSFSSTVRRASWVGRNILFQDISESGKIVYIKNSKLENKELNKNSVTEDSSVVQKEANKMCFEIKKNYKK